MTFLGVIGGLVVLDALFPAKPRRDYSLEKIAKCEKCRGIVSINAKACEHCGIKFKE